MTDQKPTCGTCRWFKNPSMHEYEGQGFCMARSMDHPVTSFEDACPAHDSGAFDEAVKRLVTALGEITFSDLTERAAEISYNEELAAVESMLKERRKP